MTKKTTFLDLKKVNQANTLNSRHLLLLKLITSFPAYKKIQRWHTNAISKDDFKDYLGEVLKQMHINIEEIGNLNIPESGGCIFVANHPTGLLEVIVWLYTILSVRSDLKMMANNWFDFVEVAQDVIISVNPFEGKESSKQNIKSYKTAKNHLANGGALMLFPAGEVAHWNWQSMGVEDPAWKKSILSLSKRTGAPIIPCYSASKNSLLFNIVGNIHPRLRTLMLAREFTTKQKKTIRIATNTQVDDKFLEKFSTDSKKMAFLRLCTESLNDKPFAEHLSHNEELILPINTQLIQAELANSKILSETDEYSIYMAYGREIPQSLQEIGRLREYNFRLIGEGSSKSLDLDHYDAHYQQIILWDKKETRILGGLRFGYGNDPEKKGVYFLDAAKIKPQFHHVLEQSLDFGRLFVVDDIKTDINGILILVRSLVSYFKSTDYNYLLGQVSIPSAYPKLAIDLIVNFLCHHFSNQEFAGLVKGRRKFKLTRRYNKYIMELISEINSSKMANLLLEKLFQGRIEIPALLRFYLKCNTKLMSFNYDKDFGTVDALMIVHRDQIPKFFK